MDKAKEMLGMDDATDAAKDATGKVGDKAADASNAAKDQAGSMSDKAKNMVDKGGDKIDNMTGGKASGHIDKGQDAAKDAIDKIPGM
ncbi:type IV secretory pathway TrbL component [Allocatelliglobosispora scoriae]|uniref:Type IV secretory pathway TrbL component n=1 Tax=Allocatelliglobosispora scoriae TaxID=643052 RepID=A0A841BIN5_9ACTN|nr:antitoxin [Allocatelliglobosispora scoriae]MBB5867056.1 type IV secretory pathway TrbL component [Allocatelliglobosispora scoriae]